MRQRGQFQSVPLISAVDAVNKAMCQISGLVNRSSKFTQGDFKIFKSISVTVDDFYAKFIFVYSREKTSK